MTDLLIDANENFILVSTKLEKIPLTTDAYRVYCHLKMRSNLNTGKCFPSYSTIGECCFRGSYPDSPPDTVRKRAIAAIKELVSFNLVLKKERKNTSNIYVLTKSTQWKKKPLTATTLARKAKRSLITPQDYPLVAPHDPPASPPPRPPQSPPTTLTRSIELDQEREEKKEVKEKKENFAQKDSLPSEQEQKPGSIKNNQEGSFSAQPKAVTTMSKNELYEARYAQLGKLPEWELVDWSRAILGDIVRHYRKSGRILSKSVTDIKEEFVIFVASKLRKEPNQELDTGYALNLIRSFEQDPNKWVVLVDYVNKWVKIREDGRVVTYDSVMANKFKSQGREWNQMQIKKYLQNKEEYLKSSSWATEWVIFAQNNYPDEFVIEFDRKEQLIDFDFKEVVAKYGN